MRNDNSGCDCIIIGIVVVLILSGIRKCVSATPDMLKAYGEALSGPYGGLWGFPLLIIIVFVVVYFANKKGNLLWRRLSTLSWILESDIRKEGWQQHSSVSPLRFQWNKFGDEICIITG